MSVLVYNGAFDRHLMIMKANECDLKAYDFK